MSLRGSAARVRRARDRSRIRFIRSAASAWSSTVKSGAQPERATVQPQQPVGDRVEGAAPDASAAARPPAERSARRQHLARGAPAEREQQDPLRVDAGLDQVATRDASVQVFPVPRRPRPAVVRRRTAPADRCSGLRSSNMCSKPTTDRLGAGAQRRRVVCRPAGGPA